MGRSYKLGSATVRNPLRMSRIERVARGNEASRSKTIIVGFALILGLTSCQNSTISSPQETTESQPEVIISSTDSSAPLPPIVGAQITDTLDSEIQRPSSVEMPAPDVLKALLFFSGGGGGESTVCRYEFPADTVLIGASIDGQHKSGGVAEIIDIDETYWHFGQPHLTAFPAICARDQSDLVGAKAISPAGDVFEPYLVPGGAWLPLGAFIYPGRWSLRVENQILNFELAIDVPVPDDPVTIANEQYRWFGGFAPDERIKIVKFGPKGSFQLVIETDENGSALAENPSGEGTLVVIGETSGVVFPLRGGWHASLLESDILDSIVHLYYWGEDWQPRVRNLRFCDVSCSEPDASELSTLSAGSRELHVSWEYEDMQVDTPYTRTWLSEGEKWVEYSDCVWQGPEDGTMNVVLREPGGLRSGQWVLLITVDDQPQSVGWIDVKGDHDFWEPAGNLTCADFP